MHVKVIASVIGAAALASAGPALADPGAPRPAGTATFHILADTGASPLTARDLARVRGAEVVTVLDLVDSVTPVRAFPPDPIDVLSEIIFTHPPDPV